MDPIVLFFIFGLVAGLLKCDLKFHSSIGELLIVILLLAIGIKGGVEIREHNFIDLLPKVLLVASLGLLIPLLAFPVLKKIGGLSRIDSASLAAHYGSVSVGTFAVCIAFLKSHNISFESYVPLFVIILEIPAIIVGLIIAKQKAAGTNIKELLGETLRSRAIVLLLGGLVIGAIAGAEKLQPYNPLFGGLFYGVLGLFLVEMGFIVSQQLAVIKRHGSFILAFGLLMPVFSGTLALGVAMLMNLSMGGALIVTILGASSSYIAVPAAMRMSLPEANLSLSLGSSLGVTFPFNVLAGIPLFYYVLKLLYV